MGARTFLPRSFKARTFFPRSLAGVSTTGATDAVTRRLTLETTSGNRLSLSASYQELRTVPQVFPIHKGDTRTVLSAELKQENTSGTSEAVDLTLMTVEFKMVDEDGTEVIAKTDSGVTVTNASTGLVQYDFSASGVSAAGTFYGYFVVTDGGETDRFPVQQRDLVISVEGD